VRRRDATLVTLCLVPILAVLGQLYFSVRFPDDNWGPIKGNYLLFASAPMFALYGAACSWLWRHPRWRLIGVLQVCGVLAVGAYSIYARWHALPQ
jgi:hypothetical protein